MKKVLIIGLPLLLVGGGGTVFTLGKMGIVNIPGITPPKKAVKSDKDKKQQSTTAKKPKKKPITPKIEAAAEPAEPKNDPMQGYAKLADLWSEMEADVLKSVTLDWKEGELAPILKQMDTAKVAEFITAVAATDAKRADRITKALQVEASRI